MERNQPPKGPFIVVNAVIRGVLGSRLHGLAGGNIALLSFTGRKSGINVDRAPTRDELADAARRSGLSVVTYQPRTA